MSRSTTYDLPADLVDDACVAHRLMADGDRETAESVVLAIVRAALRDDPSFAWVPFVASFGLDPFAD